MPVERAIREKENHRPQEPANAAALFDDAVRRAVHRHRVERGREAERALSRFELGLLLARLGFPIGHLAKAIEAGDVRLVPAETAAMLTKTVARGLHDCRLQARRSDPHYDINRHIALKRLMRWLEGSASLPFSTRSGEEPEVRRSGVECNRQFSRSRRGRTGKTSSTRMQFNNGSMKNRPA